MKLFCQNENQNPNTNKRFKILGAILFISLSLFFYSCAMKKSGLGIEVVKVNQNLISGLIPPIEEDNKDFLSDLRDVYLDKVDSMSIKKFKLLKLLENEKDEINKLNMTTILDKLIEILEEEEINYPNNLENALGNNEEFYDV